MYREATSFPREDTDGSKLSPASPVELQKYENNKKGKKEMDIEEIKKLMEEYCVDDMLNSDDRLDESEDVSGNPYGAGRYGYIRSSKNSKFMILGDEAKYEPEFNMWFEYMGCGYACWRDGKALQEADEIDLYLFHDKHPKINCKESFYDFEYGNTRNDVAYALFILTEYKGTLYRTFHFNLQNITLQKSKEYIAAIEAWHHTGELNVDSFNGIPQFSFWRRK